LLKANRFGDLRRSTLSWCRRTRISASNAARDRNSPIKAHQINLQRSLIGSEYQPIRGRGQPFWVCGRDRIWNDIPAPLASRLPMGQRIFLSLAEAAKTTGLSESTILAAIEDGRIAGMKDILDGWYVERAKLCHVFPPAPAGAAKFDNRRALVAAALMLEVGIWALVRTAGDKLRRRCIIWRLLPRMRLWGINHL
jgi:hypothetical protein